MPPGPVRRARLHIAGLGTYVASLNGRRVGRDVLAPGLTDYGRRVEHATHDVTDLLSGGDNALGVALGTGPAWITPGERYQKHQARFSRPRVIAQLEVTGADGTRTTVVTDPAWRATAGPTTASDWFGGEDHDARAEVPGWDVAGTDRGAWRPAVVAPGPRPELSGLCAPPLRVVEVLDAGPAVPLPGARARFDLPRNVAGLLRVTLTAPAGTRVELWPGERLNPDGTVDQEALGTPVFHSVTSAGPALTWTETFRYDGFRHVEVRGLVSGVQVRDVQALVVRAATEAVGTFTCSDPTITAIHALVDGAVRSNMFSVFTDCPHREKLGWLEETHLVMGAVSRGYDLAAYLRSAVRTVAEAQHPDGRVPDIAPEHVVFDGGFADDPNWGGAIALVPWLLLEHYGDRRTAERTYDAVRNYLRYLESRRSGTTETLGYDQLGDWAELGVTTTPQLVTTFGYYRVVDALARTAAALGRTADAEEFAARRDRVRADARERWYDAATGVVANGTQAASALALDMGFVPAADEARVLAALVADIEDRGGHLTVGEIALPSVFRVLARHGRDDLVHRTVVNPTAPSFGAFVAAGMTTLPEYWDMQGSLNHFMLGCVVEWFGARLAGITQAPGSLAWRHLVVRPSVVGGLTSASSTWRTVAGTVAASWALVDGAVVLDVEVPVGSDAVVHLPVPAEPDGLTARCDPPGAVERGVVELVDGRCASFAVGSGRWRLDWAAV
nr:family 78 glycoside hydrolase catalytic domain [Kineococcus siccus]